jgi:Thioesterase superfamily
MTDSTASNNSYHYMDSMRNAEHIEPSSQQLKRRQMATALQQLSSQVARMDATETEMQRYVQDLEALSQRIQGHNKVDSVQLFEKLYQGKATAEELLLDTESAVLIGKASPIGFPMELDVIGDKIVGTARIPLSFQGPPQRVHGGIVATLFDILLSRTQILCDFLGFTADLQISYKGAVPLDTTLQLEAWVESVGERKLVNAGKITVGDKVCATAQGLWIKPNTGFV